MSASRDHVHDLRRGDSVLPAWLKDAGRTLLTPIVRAAMALHLTPNTITVIGLLITLVASVLVANDHLLVGAAILTAGSLLDAVDGALARAQGGGTAFGGFLDSTLDRAGEAILYIGIGAWLLANIAQPGLPILALMVALAGLGFTAGLIGALVVVAGLTVATVVQRIWHVWRLSQAAAPSDSKEN
jgi:phosphatidylglycerophosphate synthase